MTDELDPTSSASNADQPQAPQPASGEAGADSTSTPAPVPSPVRPRQRRWRLIFGFFLIILMLLAGAAGVAFWQLQRWSRTPYGQPGEHSMAIKPRTPTREIARALRGQGLIENELYFLAWLRLSRPPVRIQAGEYRIKAPISPRELIATLRHGVFERTLTIPEGWTSGQIAERLLREQWIKTDREWLDLVARQGAEGFCFPETYRLAAQAGPAEILGRMRTRFDYEWQRLEPARRDPRAADLTTTQVVVLASMLDREARTDAEMPQIASVYLNRIRKGMKLQCCATVRYALGGVWDRPLRYADLKIDSPYNTYLHPGLPPGPIANPGRAALGAVLRPAPTDYLFYVYAGNGQHVFSRTYAEHMKAVRAARTRHPQETIPEQGED